MLLCYTFLTTFIRRITLQRNGGYSHIVLDLGSRTRLSHMTFSLCHGVRGGLPIVSRRPYQAHKVSGEDFQGMTDFTIWIMIGAIRCYTSEVARTIDATLSKEVTESLNQKVATNGLSDSETKGNVFRENVALFYNVLLEFQKKARHDKNLIGSVRVSLPLSTNHIQWLRTFRNKPEARYGMGKS